MKSKNRIEKQPGRRLFPAGKRFLALLLSVFLLLQVLTACSTEPPKDGKSAYELAVENGFDGTLEDWLNSLKGDTGAQGEKDETGTAGSDGRSVEDFKVVDGVLYVRYSGSDTYENLGKVKGVPTANPATPEHKVKKALPVRRVSESLPLPSIRKPEI